MRATTIMITASVLFSVSAEAQDQGRGQAGQSPPPRASSAMPQAPVGHRQPTPGTLPPSVRQDETSGRRAIDDLGPMTSICRNC